MILKKIGFITVERVGRLNQARSIDNSSYSIRINCKNQITKKHPEKKKHYWIPCLVNEWYASDIGEA